MGSSADKIMKKYVKERNTLFPELKVEKSVWHSKINDGWRNVPRGIVFIMNIMDNLCTGSPPSKVYLTLWQRSYESYYLKELNISSLALESGHTGQRAESTFKKKLALLKELGFILEKNNFSAMALPNPYLAVKKLHDEGRVSEELWTGLIMRMSDIGEESFS